MRLLCALIVALSLPLFARDQEKENSFNEIQIFAHAGADAILASDLRLLPKSYYAGVGPADLFSQFIKFLFPITGREKRTMFLPIPYWGEKKPQYKQFDWKEYETNHFMFYAYPEAQQTLEKVVRFLEDDYERNNETFGVNHQFTKKIPIILYQSRRDFEQTYIVGGPVPEGLGGVTEIFAWKRATFPFEGEMSKLEHVAKHEGTHIYQIAKGAKNLPLWFIEGNAETNSVYWDTEADLILRDAYVNGLFLPIQSLWQIQGSYLMYKFGNFICNYIWDEFGVEGFRKIYDNAAKMSFEDNIQASLGLTIEQLDRRVQERLVKRYGNTLRKEPDLIEKGKLLVERQFLMGSKDRVFLSGGYDGARLALYLNYHAPDGKIITKAVVKDRKFKSDSLNYFQKGASVTEDKVLFSIKRAERDELRIVNYKLQGEKPKFKLGKTIAISFETLENIEDPVWIGDDQVAFIGYENGNSGIYKSSVTSKKLEKIYQTGHHVSGLDYSPVRHELVFSQEDERDKNRIRYDRNLYTLNVETLKVTQLTNTNDIIEESPKFSPSGNYILYIGDPSNAFDLFSYNLQTGQAVRLSQLKVGARKPMWGPDGVILLNGYKEFRPNIYEVPYPTPSDYVFAPSHGEEKWSFLADSTTGKLLPVSKPIDEKLEEPCHNQKQNHDHPYLCGQSLYLDQQGKTYEAKRIAVVGTSLIVDATEKADKSKLASDEIFTWENGKWQDLKSKTVASTEIPTEVRKQIEDRLEKRPLIATWWDPNNREALILVNNRLAYEAAEFKDKKGVSLIRVSKDLTITEIKGLDLSGFKESIQWVGFLEDGVLFLAVGAQKYGPFRIFLSKPGSNELDEFDDASEFRLAPNHKSFALRKDDRLRVYSVKPFGMRYESPKDWGALRAFHFLNSDSSFWMVHEEEKNIVTTELSSATYLEKKLGDLAKEENVIKQVVIDEENNKIVLLADVKSGGDTLQSLTVFDPRRAETYRVSDMSRAKKYQNVRVKKGYLFFDEIMNEIDQPHTVVWKNQKRDTLDPVSKVKLAANDTWILGSKNKLVSYSLKDGSSQWIAAETYGFDVSGTYVVFSAALDSLFQLFEYDLVSGSVEHILESDLNQVDPVFVGDTVRYLTFRDGKWLPDFIATKDLASFSVEDMAKEKQSDLLRIDAVRFTPDEYKGPHLLPPADFKVKLLGQDAKIPYKFQQVAAAAAYDGNNLRFFASAYLDNLFSDQGLYIDAIFLGPSKFATASFVDLRNYWNYSVFYNLRSELENYGLAATKVFVLDRQREIDVYGEYEIQQYGNITTDTSSFVTPDIVGDTFHLIKAGAVFGQDVTVWDMHGPISGSRFFIRTEAGYSASSSELANVDASLDWRMYNLLLPRFGLAHRIVAGTSQGELPSVYLVGGNMSFRGVGFDDFNGQNYWVFSEDVRLPLLDFVGAKFFDPLDSFLGFLTRYFDVRGGWFVDVGSVWNNSAKANVDYATGYFFNVPTMLGIELRFHHSLFGKENFGFWIGSNW